MDLSIYMPYIKQIGASFMAGFSYSLVGWFNYWVEKRKENEEAEFDWKKMGATLTASVIVGLLLGLVNIFYKQDISLTYNLLLSIGGISIAKKLATIIWYGKDSVVDIGKKIIKH